MSKKKLINYLEVGKNEQGFTVAFMSCDTKSVYLSGYGTDEKKGIATVFIDTHNDEYESETVEIPFDVKDGESYTVIDWNSKNEISIIIVPLEFCFPKTML